MFIRNVGICPTGVTPHKDIGRSSDLTRRVQFQSVLAVEGLHGMPTNSLVAKRSASNIRDLYTRCKYE
jgi:hypothetical protein